MHKVRHPHLSSYCDTAFLCALAKATPMRSSCPSHAVRSSRQRHHGLDEDSDCRHRTYPGRCKIARMLALELAVRMTEKEAFRKPPLYPAELRDQCKDCNSVSGAVAATAIRFVALYSIRRRAKTSSSLRPASCPRHVPCHVACSGRPKFAPIGLDVRADESTDAVPSGSGRAAIRIGPYSTIR
jgi:hypothetical protein